MGLSMAERRACQSPYPCFKTSFVFVGKVPPQFRIVDQACHSANAVEAAIFLDELVIFLDHLRVLRSPGCDLSRFYVMFPLPPSPRNAKAGVTKTDEVITAVAIFLTVEFLLMMLSFLYGFYEILVAKYLGLRPIVKPTVLPKLMWLCCRTVRQVHRQTHASPIHDY